MYILTIFQERDIELILKAYFILFSDDIVLPRDLQREHSRPAEPRFRSLGSEGRFKGKEHTGCRTVRGGHQKHRRGKKMLKVDSDEAQTIFHHFPKFQKTY